jgi:transposase
MRRRSVKKSGGQEAQALGRSRGGFSTKIHIAVDALGNPRRLILMAGQRHDSPLAPRLIEGDEAQALIADKGYDSDPLIATVTARGRDLPPLALNARPVNSGVRFLLNGQT